MKKPIYGFWHNAVVAHWEIILKEQYKKLCDSGLLDASEKVILNTVGTLDPTVLPEEIRNDKRLVLMFEEDRETLEYNTLIKMQEEVKDKDCNIWYIHVKGACSSHGDPNNNCWHWREYMEYFIVENWEKCVPYLDMHDLVGVEFRHYPVHFSGNFWWSNSRYINSLSKPLNKSVKDIRNEKGDDEKAIGNFRLTSEFWVGQGKPVRVQCFFNYNSDLYREPMIRTRNYRIFK